jgi:hypothetical protein
MKKSHPGQEKIIKYQTDPSIKIKCEKGEHSVHICDINSMTYRDYFKVPSENGFLMFNGSKKLNLDFEFGNIWGHTFQVAVDKQKEDELFYVCFSKYSRDVEENAVRSINTFKDIQSAQNCQQVKLPKIQEKESKKSAQGASQFDNPITAALMRFRNKAKAFKPESYLAKLSLFETHAYIREKYS